MDITQADLDKREIYIKNQMRDILYHTPQYFVISNTRPDSVDEGLATIKQILTSDYSAVLQKLSTAEHRILELERERRTVRAFFGVVEEQ